MVVTAVDEVPHLLERQARRLRPVEHVTAGELFGQHGAAGDAFLIGAVEAGNRIRDGGACRGNLTQILNAEARIAEQGVREDLTEGRQGLRLIIAPKRSELHVIGIGELQKYLNGDRPLVALDQVKVTCGNAEIGGHARLGQPSLAAQTPNPLTCKDFFLRDHAVPLSQLPSNEAACATLLYKIYISNRIAQESC